MPLQAMKYELIAHIRAPSVPMAFSSVLRAGTEGWIYRSDRFVIVVEEQPICAMQSMQMMSSGSRQIPDCDMHYVAAASVFYRKSCNPHGPSFRPIFVVALEHSPFSTEYEPIGFLRKLFGSKPKPKWVFVGVFAADGRSNLGSRPNDFTRASAKEFLLELGASKVGLTAQDFAPSGTVRQGPNAAVLE
jgi:hypothetical protein